MDEDLREKIALFRFGVIAPLVGRHLDPGERESILKQITGSRWQIPGSPRTTLGRSTVLKWLACYRSSGENIESLKPRRRGDRGCSRSIDPETEAALVRLKQELPEVSLPVLMRVARDRRIIGWNFAASRQSIYRLFTRHGLDKPLHTPVDRRRFEAELPNDLWQSDCMHGPRVTVKGDSRKSYLFAIIDDHSRLITHCQFYLRENIDSFRECLIQALAKRGLPRRLYTDNGSAFRSHQLRYGCARLGIALLHSEPGVPEGRGKIERFFRTLRMQLLPLLPKNLSLQELNERLHHWIEKDYHQRVHSSTGHTPLKRYLEHLQALRPAPRDLTDHFRIPVRRKVDKDRTVSLNGSLFEAPPGLIGQTVTLLYHKHDPRRIEVLFDEQSYGFLTPLNTGVNSRVRRLANQHTELIPPQQPSGNAPPYQGGSLFVDKSAEEDTP
jgi:transposase InsO family protein